MDVWCTCTFQFRVLSLLQTMCIRTIWPILLLSVANSKHFIYIHIFTQIYSQERANLHCSRAWVKQCIPGPCWQCITISFANALNYVITTYSKLHMNECWKAYNNTAAASQPSWYNQIFSSTTLYLSLSALLCVCTVWKARTAGTGTDLTKSKISAELDEQSCHKYTVWLVCWL